MHPAPFCIALEMKLFPSLFFPFIVKNKLSFLIVLVSIESPLKLIFYLRQIISLLLIYFADSFVFLK